MSKTKKIFSTLIFIISLLLLTTKNAQAIVVDGITGGAVDDAIGSALSYMGIQIAPLRYFSQSFNVSQQKKQEPQVSLSFEPADPVPGQKVTVVATPLYFLNDSKDLYFTWYLKPAACPDRADNNPSQNEITKCDENGDGRITIEDYKIKAMRIIASNGFGWDEKNAQGQTVYDTSTNHGSSYTASWGGDDQKGKNAYCYVHDTKTGNEFSIQCDNHLFPHAPGRTTGDGSYSLDEEKFWHTNPNADDTAGTSNGDEANVAGLGINTFTWTYDEGDQVGVAIEGVSVEPTQKADSSYKTMWALTNNKCDLGIVNAASNYPITTTAVTYDSTGACGANVNDEQITTTTVQVIARRQANNIAVIRTQTYQTKIIDSNCDGVFSETPSAAYNPTTTCPSGRPNTIYTGLTCVGPDSSVNLNTSSLKNIKKSSDLNNCLYSNFADPKQGGGQAEAMNIDLSYSPDFPMNDPTANSSQGDMLLVNSSITNGQADNYLKYKWEVFASDTPNPDSWGDPISVQYLPEATQTIGVGLDSFQFRLNLTNDALGNRVKDKNRFYLKVKLTLSENVPKSIDTNYGNNSNVATRQGQGDVVIPITSTTDHIKIFDTTATPSGDKIQLAPGTTERCTAGLDQTICPVTKDEIVALRIDDNNLTDFAWMLDDNPITAVSPDCLAGDCVSGTMASTNTAYFPVLDDTGTQYNITLTAVNSKTGDKVNISRVFQVVDPAVTITSADTSVCTPILLGSYIDNNGKYWPDYSQTDFQSLSYSPIKLQAAFYGFTPTADNYSWVVDDAVITKSNAGDSGFSIDNNGILTLPGEATDETYNVAMAALYTQNDATRKALNTFWNVQYNEFEEQQLAAVINVTTTDNLSGTPNGTSSQIKDPQKKILASLYSATPGYLAFLLRIVLTAFVMLMAVRIIFSFFPKRDDVYEI